jgi:hypothetical protein
VAKPAPAAPVEHVAWYEKVVATIPGLERKGAALPYTSVNGNMASILTKEGVLGLRLSPEDRSRFIAKYKAKLLEQYGIVLKEYVAVPRELLRNTKALKPWFAAGYAYVCALRPKPTTKPKKSAK